MKSVQTTARVAIVLALCAGWTTIAAADDAAPDQSNTTEQSDTGAAGDFDTAAPLTEDNLDTMRGGQGVIVTSTQDLTANNVGNSVNADTVGSGSIALEGDAFSSFNGVANVVVNTGHNNNLQGSVSVNVIYNDQPPPPPASQ